MKVKPEEKKAAVKKPVKAKAKTKSKVARKQSKKTAELLSSDFNKDGTLKVRVRSTDELTAGVDLAKRQSDLDSANSDENSSQGIASQVEEFLSKGKEISRIPTGVSGITQTGGTKHITISRNKPQQKQ